MFHTFILFKELCIYVKMYNGMKIIFIYLFKVSIFHLGVYTLIWWTISNLRFWIIHDDYLLCFDAFQSNNVNNVTLFRFGSQFLDLFFFL